MAHHRQVVGDADDPGAARIAQVHQQVHHLALRRDVEPGGRFVGDDHRRVGRQRPGDGDAARLPAAERVRVAIEQRGVQPDHRQQRRRVAPAAQPTHRLIQDGVDPQARIERAGGALEDQRHVPPQPAEAALGQVRQGNAVDGNAAGIGRDQPQYRPRQCRLARAALADDAQHLAAPHAEGDVVDDRRARTAPRHADGQARDGQRIGHAAALWHRTAWPSPAKRRGGTAARQEASAYAQRSAKRQPGMSG